jgi:TonB family protein
VWNNYFEKLTTEAELHSNSPSPSTEVKPADAVDKTQNIFRVGPKVSAPKPEHTPDPDYSELARQEKVTGVVTLAVIVDTDGSTKDIRIFKPIGFGLDEMACEKVLIWRFKPGMIDGTPVPVRITVETTFSLY